MSHEVIANHEETVIAKTTAEFALLYKEVAARVSFEKSIAAAASRGDYATAAEMWEIHEDSLYANPDFESIAHKFARQDLLAVIDRLGFDAVLQIARECRAPVSELHSFRRSVERGEVVS